MAVPKKKASKARSGRRYHINSALRLPELYRDAESGVVVRRHYVNETNGIYRNRLLVVKQKDDSASKSKQSGK